MRRLTTIILLVFVIIPITCIFFKPDLRGIDSLSISLAIFSLTIAIVTFFAPTILRLRDKALEIDKLVQQNKQIKREMLKTNVNYLKGVNKIQNDTEIEETISKGKQTIDVLTNQIENPTLISSDIGKIIDGYYNYMKWCLVAIVLEFIVVEILFSSECFRLFVGDSLACITSGWPLSSIKDIIASDLKISSLTLTLFFLVCASNDMFYVMKSLRTT